MKKNAPIAKSVNVMKIIEIRRRILRPSLSTRIDAANEEINCMIPIIIVDMSAERPTLAA